MSSEHTLITTQSAPITGADLRLALDDVGVVAGDTVLVHSALGRLGWIAGGVQTMIEAILAHVVPDGTIVMPGFSSQLSDPREWTSPAIPQDWHARVMAEMPTFDPAMTPTRGMGKMPEAFRALPGTHRSFHPIDSFLAHGARAQEITVDQPLGPGLGPKGPLGRLYDLDAKVVFLGSGFETCTCFHLAEYGLTEEVVHYPTRRFARVTQWEAVEDAVKYHAAYAVIGAAFEETGAVARSGRAGGPVRAFSLRRAVDFAHGYLRDPENAAVIEIGSA